MKLRRSMLITAFFYTLAVLIYLFSSTASLIFHSLDKSAPIYVDIESNAVYDDIKILEKNEQGLKIVTSGIDSNIIYSEDKPFRGWNFVLKAEFDRPIGEMVLYYNNKEGQDFSENRKIWARKNSDGDWYFDLKGKKYSALRLDIDSRGGVIWHIESIAINTKPPVSYFFKPGSGDIFRFLLFPALASAVFTELYSIFAPELKKLKKKK